MNVRWLGFVICLAAGVELLVADDSIDVAPRIEVEAEGVRLTLIAEHPEVVTPTGIDVDDSGNVWLVCSHTHFRPDDYRGPEHDEVIVLSADGTRRVFYNQTIATMDLELGPDGWVYLAERDRILRVRDRNGDGVGDQVQPLAELQTDADYPHNGLSGLAWHPGGDLIFGLGDNHDQAWTLHGAGGETFQGVGEGAIFRCRPDGTDLRRIAEGFWNPFGVCVRTDGVIFAADNDPGARPPCRLLHIVPGGQYGYQRSYGSAPVHPFICWNGELRGTLPMTHALREAPCGIVPLGRGLIVPSWTEHRIDFYPLRASGASFEAERIELVSGGRQFRPTCITRASPTVFYLTDWVYGSYEVHGYGRVWRLEIDREQAAWMGPLDLPPPTAQAELAEELRRGGKSYGDKELFQLAASDDPFLARAALDALADRSDRFEIAGTDSLGVDDRLNLLLALRKGQPRNFQWIEHFLEDPHPELQFEALRWISDQRLERYLPVVEERLRDRSIDFRLFEALLATWNTLSGNPSAGIAEPQMLLARLRDADSPPPMRAFALRLLDPRHAALKPELWDELSAVDHPRLTTELARSLASRGDEEAQRRLVAIATDTKLPVQTRADAIAGIAPDDQSSRSVLLKLASAEERAVREEALRSLRFGELRPAERKQLVTLASRFESSAGLVQAALDPDSLSIDRPAVEDTKAWRERLDAVAAPLDIETGRRIFFHARVGMCANCHRHRGRGAVVGPDLTAASSLGDRDRLLTALLQPSLDVDPQYHPWSLMTEDDNVFTGILLRDGGGGTEVFRDSEGRERIFQTSRIVARKPLTTSMMPDGLVDLMTDREIRDLLGFLNAHQ